MTTLTNARLVLPDRVLDGGWLRVDGDRIGAIGPPPTSGGRYSAAPSGGMDLRGSWVLPGFIDLHVHGGAGGAFDAADAGQARRAVAFHRQHGTTTLLASLVSAPLDAMAAAASVLADLAAERLVAGIHLEGPFLSVAQCGAHDPASLRAPDRGVLAWLLGAGRGQVRMVTVAPEQPAAAVLITDLLDAGAIAAVGHTDASFDVTRAAYDQGATVATHLFNGMRGMHHREPGPALASISHPQVVVELINDGVHVHPEVLRLTCAAVGVDRVALVTDAMGAAGMADGRYPLGPRTVQVTAGIARVPGGTALAGSTLTMDRAVRRAVSDVGLSIVEAAIAAATTPARVLGMAETIGSIEAGKQADLVVLDEHLDVAAVMARGRWVRKWGQPCRW